MTSCSQAYQDLYVVAMLDKKNGTYLDIGCFVPKDGNNTYLLDHAFGWFGISIDKESFNFDSGARAGAFIKCDATQPYPEEAMEIGTKMIKDGKIDYLSLDVDEDTNKALPIALAFAKYSVITIEHDLYARGKENQDEQRKLLSDAGYVLHVPNVHYPNDPSLVFEDWWCHPDLLDGVPTFGDGPNDAAWATQKIWLNKFGQDLGIYTYTPLEPVR